ncbi:hypothetical protein GOODEAATRI_018156, partial [Goodea atripinnis]
INGECSCFQSIDLLKSRPAHLAAFLHHVVSQFEPAPLRRPELIPEELCKQYSQVLQDSLLSDLQKNLEDFRQKRSMGLTLAEDELSKLGSERGKDQPALEKECSCAEHILTKIEEILVDSISAVELNKRSPKISQPDFVIPEPPDHPALSSGRSRVNQLSQGSDTSTQSVLSVSSLGPSSSDSTGHETDSSVSPFCIQPRLSDGVQSGEHQDGLSSPTSSQFDFGPSNLDHREEDQEAFR